MTLVKPSSKPSNPNFSSGLDCRSLNCSYWNGS